MGHSEVQLDGLWLLTCNERQLQCEMNIPGDIFSSLHKAELIPDPYFADNEESVKWVGESQWEISREFHLSEIKAQHYYLDLTWVDTFTEIFINDQPIINTCNLFTRYRPDITHHLIEGSNTIRIQFNRVDLEAAKRAETLPFPVPWSVGNNTVPHMNTVRKVQCHAGWDWGITLMTSGIYDQVVIRQAEQARLDYLAHSQKHIDGKVIVSFAVDVMAYEQTTLPLTFEFNGETQEVISEITAGANKLICEFTVESPKLWWPAGHGEQPLYDVTVSAQDGQQISQRIGLRTLEVDNSKDDLGKRLVIKVNDREIFCKGANWIPSDAMPSRQTRKQHERLLRDAVAVNMNTVRVWGGGQYEHDHFYELCDELGLPGLARCHVLLLQLSI